MVYHSILQRSAKTAGFDFDTSKPSPLGRQSQTRSMLFMRSRALARLACMANILDAEKGRALEEAFYQMEVTNLTAIAL